MIMRRSTACSPRHISAGIVASWTHGSAWRQATGKSVQLWEQKVRKPKEITNREGDADRRDPGSDRFGKLPRPHFSNFCQI
jgi:hypothetical protein